MTETKNILSMLEGTGRAHDEKNEYTTASVKVSHLGEPKEYTSKAGKKTVRRAFILQGTGETYYTFADNIKNAPEFISGVADATLTIAPNNYTDANGNQVQSFDVKKLEFHTAKGLSKAQLDLIAQSKVALFYSDKPAE